VIGRTFAPQVIGFTLLATGGTQSQAIARSERTTIDAAKAGDDMCRAASEYWWHIDAAVNRDIRSRARSPRAEPQDSAALHTMRNVERCRPAVDPGLEVRAGYCYYHRLVEPQFRTKERRFQRCCARGVSDQRVCETMRVAIHGT